MKIVHAVMICCAVLIGTLSGYGADTAEPAWKHYATDDQENRYFYDHKRIERRNKSLVRVWVRAEYSAKQQKLKEGITLWEIDCASTSLRGISASVTNKDGSKETIATPSSWAAIPADSTASQLFDLVCKKGAPAK